MKSDDVYYITYLNDLFLNFEFDDVILFNNMTMKHIKLNTTKQKIIYDQNVTRDIGLEYINKNIKDKCLIHGVSSIIKTLKLEKHFIFNKYLTMEQIYECFRKDEMLTKHKRLKECLDYIKNEDLIDRVKFGKDIRDAIDIYMIKTLYCSKIKYDKLKKIYSEDVLNFEILIIDKVEQGDIGDIFMKDYNGIIGYTYY